MCRPQQPNNDQSQQVDEQSSAKCPFSIRALNDSTYLFRENDSFVSCLTCYYHHHVISSPLTYFACQGEHPHIYAKVCTTPDGQGIIVLSDTGVGTTNADNTTLWTFLASTINERNF